MEGIIRKIRTFWRLSISQKYLILVCYLVLLRSYRMTKTWKHEKIVNFLQNKARQNSIEKDQKLIIDLKSSLEIVSKYCFNNSNCYDQAITASIILSQRKIKHFFFMGTIKTQDGHKQFHAWVSDYVKHFVITGGQDSFNHSIIQEIKLQ